MDDSLLHMHPIPILREPPGTFEGMVSNNLLCLFDSFKKHFCQVKNPFLHRLVIVPDAVTKSWLQIQLARELDSKIAMGLKYILPEDCVTKLSSLIIPRQHKHLTYQELVLLACGFFKQQIMGMLENTRLPDLVHLSPEDVLQIQQYIFDLAGNDKEGILLDKAIYRFARTIAHKWAFDRWWKVTTGKIEQKRGGRADLERKLILELNSISPSNVQIDFSSPPSIRKSCEIHAFGFSSLCPFIFETLLKLHNKIPVYNWFISPCMMFWSDICSDEEAKRLQLLAINKNISETEHDTLEELLFDRNALLANCGKIGRQFSVKVEDLDVEIREEYAASFSMKSFPQYFQNVRQDALSFWQDTGSSNSSKLDMLKLVQSDILLLQGRRETLVSIAKDDSSISIHAVPTKLREIEHLYLSFMEWASAHNKNILAPWTFMVFSPEIDEYREYIECVFGQKGSQLTYQFLEKENSKSPTELVFAFENLLALIYSRWTADGLYTLFQNKYFCQKFAIQPEEQNIVKNWIYNAGFSWGINSEHRKKILEDEGFEQLQDPLQEGTWKSLEERLVRSWVETRASGEAEAHMLDTSTSELLGKCVATIHSLYKDLSYLLSAKDLKVSEWGDFFACLLKAYFSPDPASKDEVSKWYQLLETIERFKECSKVMGDRPLSFTLVKQALSLSIKDLYRSQDPTPQATVVFASIGSIRNIPAPFVSLIGMNDREFPRKQEELLLTHGYSLQDYKESSLHDVEKYLFMEAFLAAKDVFYLSYQGYSFEERAHLPPAGIVNDLLYALDECCTVVGDRPSEVLIKKHGLMPFKATEVVTEEVAKSQQNNGQLPSIFFDGPETNNTTEQSSFSKIVYTDLRTLCKATRSPLDIYFQKQMKISFSRWNDIRLDNEEYGQDSFEYWKLRKLAFARDEAHIIPLVDNLSRATGLAKKMLMHRLVEERKEYIEACNDLRVVPSKQFSVEMSSQCSSPEEIIKGKWIVPAPTFDIEDDGTWKTVVVEGEIDSLCEEGFLINAMPSLAKIIGVWPELLIRAYLGNIGFCAPLKNILFLKNKKRVPFSVGNAVELLKKQVLHARDCENDLICIYPEWVEQILAQEYDSILKEIDKTKKGIDKFTHDMDPALAFFLSKISNEWLLTRFPTWKNSTELLYGDLAKEFARLHTQGDGDGI
jgi:exodeoxyribonuclease V gamma subunit